ncbi:MAG TPA: choice-of-anchor I family protein [Bryobacteraceae bacterium]|nr:choice-of-anchor I family protein [Bryobacteraceae bacterium]
MKTLGTACLVALSTLCAQELRLEKLGTHLTGVFNRGSAEISAYDAASRRLFVVNGDRRQIDVLDLDSPSQPRPVQAIRIDPAWGNAPNSIAVKNGVVAVAVEAARRTDAGSVIFFDAQGRYQNHVPTGAVPDMVTFSPDGRWVLTANEGEPSANYATDPEGSVTVIDLAKGVANPSVRQVRFTEWNTATVSPGMRIFGPGASFAQDVEPEYIAVSPDSTRAWVTLQENNAIAEIDVAGARIVRVLPLGYKDHSKAGNGLDVSDRDNKIDIRNWPIFGMYMPDGIAAISQGGRTYLLTANEGDAREYDGFAEEARVGALKLDATAFPDAPNLARNENLGRLTVTKASGDTDGDGDYDRLYTLGGRSFSVWDTEGNLVWDSGDQFEQLTAKEFPRLFNSDASGGLDTRSDNKGPEPETIVTATFGNRTYAFIALERMGGVMVYDITDVRSPRFVHYTWGRLAEGRPEAGTAGDHGPEGLLVIPAAESPTGEPLLVTANEVSGSTTIYRIVLPQASVSARIRSDKAVTTETEYLLDASGSTGGGLTYSWRSVDGKASLLDAGSARARAYFGSGIGDYTFEVTVTDKAGAAATQRTTITYLGIR